MKVRLSNLSVFTSKINLHCLHMSCPFDSRFSVGCKASSMVNKGPKSQTQNQIMVSTPIPLSSVTICFSPETVVSIFKLQCAQIIVSSNDFSICSSLLVLACAVFYESLHVNIKN